jgi:membrane protease YdiL (CAAX protease family)
MTFPPEKDDLPRETGELSRGIAAEVTWGVREIAIGGLLIVGLLFVLLTIAVLAIEVAGYDPESAEGLAIQILLTSLPWDIAIVLVVYQLVSKKGAGWRELGLRPASASGGASPMRQLFLTVGLAYIASILSVQAYAVMLEAIGLDELLPSQQIPDEIYDFGWLLAMFAIFGVTLVPFAEELFFRGFFFAGLRRRLMFPLAAGISGFFFSLAHADPGLIIPFTGVGIILAYSYERTGTLLAPIGVHVLFNLGSFLVLIFVPEARE